jgi:hypothetical protein
MSARCVPISNPNSLSSSEIGIDPGMRRDGRRLLVESI